MELTPATWKVPLLSRISLLVVAVLILGAGTAYAWFRMFSGFRAYDDEGYFLVLVRHLLDGRRIYDDVFTLYGPAYLAYRWLLNGVCAVPLDTDGVRITTLGAWLVCALLTAWIVRSATRDQRFSGWCVLAAAGCAVLHLAPLTNEPGHPQDLTQIFLLGGLAAFVALRGAHAALGAFVLGFALAGTAWTKVNLGIFLGLPVALLLIPHSSTRIVRVLRGSLLGSALALPWVLMRAHLTEGWALGLGSVANAGILAAFAYFDRGSGDARNGSTWQRELVFALIGVFLCTLVCVGFALSRGSTLAGMFQSIVLLPARFTTDILLGMTLPVEACVAAFMGLIAAAVVRWRGERLPAWALPVAELVFGLFVLLNIVPHPERLIPYALPFAWLVLAKDTPQHAARLPLVLAAPLQALQIFPVSGTQEALGSSLLIPIAVIAFADACAAIAPVLTPSRVRLVMGGTLAVALSLFVMLNLVRGARRGWEFYSNDERLPYPGLRWTHISERIAPRIRFLADTITSSSSDFLSVRGDNSLYLWTGRKPLTSVIVGHSFRLFDDRQQAELAEAHASAPHVLVLDTPVRVEPELRARLPFFQLLRRSFHPIAFFGQDELCVRRDATAPKLASCVVLPEPLLQTPDARLSVRWPPSVEGPALEHLQIADLVNGVVFADSAQPDARYRARLWDGNELLFEGRPGESVSLARLAAAGDLRLELPQPLPQKSAAFTLARFFAANEQPILSLAFVIVPDQQ